MDSDVYSVLASHDTLFHMYTDSGDFLYRTTNMQHVFSDMTHTMYNMCLDKHQAGVRFKDSVYDSQDTDIKHVYQITDLKKFQHFRLKHGL